METQNHLGDGTARRHALLNFPLSRRARQVLGNAGLTSADQLATKTAAELMKYRNCGRGTLMEFRLALARLNLSLLGEPIYILPELPEEGMASEKLKALKLQRDEINVRINQLAKEVQKEKAARRKPPKDPQLDAKILAKWKELREYASVAGELNVTVNKVRCVVLKAARR